MPSKVAIVSTAGLTVVGTLCTLYTVSQFLRASVGVIAPDLAAEVGLSAFEVGLLSSVFFFTFAAAQVPLGLALDRFGPWRCLLVTISIVICGIVAFATAAAAGGLIVGRVLLGLGSASFLMAPLAIYARWFAPERFSTLTGIHLGIGSMGTLFATAPLAMAAAALGWRASFLGVALITLAIGLLVLILVRDHPPGVHSEVRRETLRESIGGIVEAMRTPSVGRLFLVNMSTYSSFLLIVGLWGAPYLTHVYGYDLRGRGELLFIPAVTQVVGSFFWGPMDRVFGGYKRPVLLGGGATVLILLALASGPLPGFALVIILGLLGFSSAVMAVVVAHGKALFPTRLIGRGITLLNMGTMGGVFLSQTLSGAVIELFPLADGAYPLDAYRLIFVLQAAFLAVTLILYLGARDPRPSAAESSAAAPLPERAAPIAKRVGPDEGNT